MSSPKVLPVFPLNAVLFPTGHLPLRIFEPRYKRMLALCGVDNPFVVVRIRHGKEVGEPAFVFDVGCTAMIKAMTEHESGYIDIIIEGAERVALGQLSIESDGLMMGAVALINESTMSLDELDTAFQIVASRFNERGFVCEDANTLTWRIADQLPLNDDQRQQLLEMTDAQDRLQKINEYLAKT